MHPKDQKRVVYDTISGCFSDMLSRELPKGWQFSMSYQLYLSSKGIFN